MSTITEIQASAFEGSGLTSVIIPSSVTSIGINAFKDCTSLTNVVLERYGNLGYTTLSLNCFSGTTAINFQNYACLHDIYTNGYTEENLRSGPYQDYRDPNSSTIIYTGAGFDNGAVDYAITGACFNEDTKILCFKPDSNEEYYKPIQNLNKGDLVKTYLHGYRKVDVACKGRLKNNTKWFTTCMYKMSKTETNNLTEDLFVIGGHSLLVDELSKEEHLRTCSIWGTPLKIDEKYLLLAGITDKFERIEGNDVYTYYHFCVENDGNDETRYGVWANGALVETPCKKDILKFRNVQYV
jgi:hypothetical protein